MSRISFSNGLKTTIIEKIHLHQSSLMVLEEFTKIFDIRKSLYPGRYISFWRKSQGNAEGTSAFGTKKSKTNWPQMRNIIHHWQTISDSDDLNFTALRLGGVHTAINNSSSLLCAAFVMPSLRKGQSRSTAYMQILRCTAPSCGNWLMGEHSLS